MKMYWVLAPEARMPSIAAWLRLRTSFWSMSWYSLSILLSVQCIWSVYGGVYRLGYSCRR